MINHEDTATLFLKETYPHFKSADYDIVWSGSDCVDVIWKRGKHKVTTHHTDELISLLTGNERTFQKEIDSFVSSIHPLDYMEASEYGFLTLSPKTSSWEVSSTRPGGIIQKSFFDSFDYAEKTYIKEIWSKTFNRNAFTVKSENLLIEIVSSHHSIPSTHCLFSSEIVGDMLKDTYDISDKTQVLIGSKSKDSILIGHEDAVERLFDIPGNTYCRKDYMNIDDELWSNHNG